MNLLEYNIKRFAAFFNDAEVFQNPYSAMRNVEPNTLGTMLENLSRYLDWSGAGTAITYTVYLLEQPFYDLTKIDTHNQTFIEKKHSHYNFKIIKTSTLIDFYG